VPVSVRPGSESLELRGLTYEHSGFYTCTASNGIKVFGTNTEFIEGTAVQLLVKCKINVTFINILTCELKDSYIHVYIRSFFIHLYISFKIEKKFC
jgi:hypothetical protein